MAKLQATLDGPQGQDKVLDLNKTIKTVKGVEGVVLTQNKVWTNKVFVKDAAGDDTDEDGNKGFWQPVESKANVVLATVKETDIESAGGTCVRLKVKGVDGDTVVDQRWFVPWAWFLLNWLGLHLCFSAARKALDDPDREDVKYLPLGADGVVRALRFDILAPTPCWVTWQKGGGSNMWVLQFAQMNDIGRGMRLFAQEGPLREFYLEGMEAFKDLVDGNIANDFDIRRLCCPEAGMSPATFNEKTGLWILPNGNPLPDGWAFQHESALVPHADGNDTDDDGKTGFWRGVPLLLRMFTCIRRKFEVEVPAGAGEQFKCNVGGRERVVRTHGNPPGTTMRIWFIVSGGLYDETDASLPVIGRGPVQVRSPEHVDGYNGPCPCSECQGGGGECQGGGGDDDMSE